MFSQNLLAPSGVILVGPGRERRSHQREQPVCGISATIEARDQPSAVGALVVNISTAGLAFQIARPHKVGTVLSVCLTNASRLFTCTRLIVVRYCHEHPTHGHLVGCEFLSKVDYGQLRALIDSSDLSTSVGRLGFLGDQ
jgi:hypothetical protein